MRHIVFGLIGLLVLSACSQSGSENSESTQFETAASVDAGDDLTVGERDGVEIVGSIDGQSAGMTIEWQQVSGPMPEQLQTAGLTLNFDAPTVQTTETLTFRLTASDGSSLMLDEMTVTVLDRGNGPSGPSSQGVTDNSRERRSRSKNRRENRRMLATREVRTYDGTNNNLNSPQWGAAFIHLQRLGEAAYADGVEDLAGPNRPSARVVSNQLVAQAEGESIANQFGASDFVWQWGQFLDHDIDLTDGAEEAANISVPAGDVHFDPQGTGLVEIPFNRALFDPETGIDSENPREQENEITSWIDGSMVYGSDDERAAALRAGADNPYLATSEGDLLPFNVDALTNANGFVSDPTTLFLAGDIRANEQLGLAVMHTLFVREHNRLAAELEADFPNNTADEVFEATRRLVVATIQKITYEEWLPVLIGADAIPEYVGYDATLNPSIYNEFSAASFRLGHSMLNEQLWRLDEQGQPIEAGHVDLAAAFFTAPRLLTERNSLDPVLRGLAAQRHQTIDTKIVHDVRNFLFGAPGDGGLDLASLNIQRGRDHGLPDYNSMRVVMGLDPVASFAEITADAETAEALAATYGDVNDIDLWVGGLAEDRVGDSQLGELFTAILAKQFAELRDGDRFWYERDLTDREMSRIEDHTLARVIRANTDIGRNEIPDNVFLVE